MKKIFLALLLLLPIFLFAKIETTYLTVEGVGKTRAEAIKNGLIEAIKQTKGVAISSQRSYIKAINETGISVDGDSTHAVAISEQSVKNIYEATKGFIKNYSIVDSYKEGDNWVVKLQIATKHYKAPGLSHKKRRKMAVIPFEYKNSYPIFGKYESGKEISKRFTQALISKLTQARKFAILDRENGKYYQNEKNFILSGDSHNDEYLKLGKRLGADYLLIGQILDFSIGSKHHHNNNSLGIPISSETKCNYTVGYRILLVSTQQIKWSDTISGSFPIKHKGSTEAVVASASDKIATKILNSILSNIYPPMIVAVTANNIVINQGGNSVSVGERFKVFSKGERLVDPYTHEFLGYEEIEAGEIVIKSVKPKVSYAKLISGVAKKGMILRRVKSDKEGKKEFHSEGEAETDVKIAPGGGVVLPFD